ncbi:MAG TPA: carbohydrate ABC transporter permease [Solirubrobacteraceae bacterium]|jgi:multiple sugar transport system permease protein|nr:carbohydrate ABC transporter permease [Solirubrobacteraceae bacterium]
MSVSDRVTRIPWSRGQRRSRPRRPLTPRRAGAAILLRVVLLVIIIIPLFPIYWMIISALKGPKDLLHVPPDFVPTHITFHAFSTVFSAIPLGDGFLSSFITSGIATVSVVVTSVAAGYIFAKHRFRGKELLFRLTIGTMFIPASVTLVPLYWLISSMGLNNSYLGVVLPWLANAFGIFLMRQFISDIPDEIIEAARLDGSSELRILIQVITPLLRPAIVTLAVFAFVYYWNNFLWPLSILQAADKFPVVLQLNTLMSYSSGVQFESVVMAGALLASLPSLLVFFLAQRVFVAGISRTGIVG